MPLIFKALCQENVLQERKILLFRISHIVDLFELRELKNLRAINLQTYLELDKFDLSKKP